MLLQNLLLTVLILLIYFDSNPMFYFKALKGKICWIAFCVWTVF